MVLSVLAAAGNWVAVGATLAALGGVVVATFVLLRTGGNPPTPSIGPPRVPTGTRILRRTHALGKSERVIPGVAPAWLGS